MNLRRSLVVAKLGLALLIVTSIVVIPARADEITYNFSGTISTAEQSGTAPVGGPYSVTYGQTFTGTFSFDSGTTAYYSTPDSNAFSDPASRMSITIGSMTYAESFLDLDGTPTSYQVVTYDDPDGSNYYNEFYIERFASTFAGVNDNSTEIEVNLSNLTPNLLGYLPTSGLPTSLSLAELPNASFYLEESVYNTSTDSRSSDFFVTGAITSLSLAPALVPEPSSVVLVGLAVGIATVRCWTRRRCSLGA